MMFKARAYGRKHAKVMCGKEEVLSQSAPDGSSYQFCCHVVEELERVIDDAMFNRGPFVQIKELKGGKHD